MENFAPSLKGAQEKYSLFLSLDVIVWSLLQSLQAMKETGLEGQVVYRVTAGTGSTCNSHDIC